MLISSIRWYGESNKLNFIPGKDNEPMGIGIITMFHYSFNYGGILQAYSLTQCLLKRGIEAEQIRYNHFTAFPLKKRIGIRIRRIISIIRNPKYFDTTKKINRRNQIIFREAEEIVPHSNKVYTEKTIASCVKDYSMFITGSDQVWHGEWPAYLLSFVPTGKRKIAYAASTGKSKLTDADIKNIQEKTRDFHAISVREKDTKEELSKALPASKIEFVLDPTLLLEKTDWEKITTRKIVKEKYLFCYFLSTDRRMRSIATEYGGKYGLKVVSIPHMQGRVNLSDLNFGDIQIFDASPQDFMSYIKYADIVFTDSFHGTVFSQIFNTQYVVFGRTEQKEMNNRVETLTDIFHTRYRFITENQQFNLEYVEKLEPIDYSIVPDEFEIMRKKSIDFLLNSLK